MTTIEINRAPVLTLWASVVAERLGYDREEALSLGKCLAGCASARASAPSGLRASLARHVGPPWPP
jgi:hypothetical protein